MSYYRRDDNGAERVAVIAVTSAGYSIATGVLLGTVGSIYTNSNGDQFLLCIVYDEAGNEV